MMTDNKIVVAPQPTPLNPPAASGELDDLLALIARLRADCPWDKKQTNMSLIPFAIEETYELAEAIQEDHERQQAFIRQQSKNNKQRTKNESEIQTDLGNPHYDDEDLKGELGDVLLQIVLHCQIYAEQGRFDFQDVVQTLQKKMIRRHPHVFDAHNLADAEAVKERWDEIKAEENAEKIARGKTISKLDKVKTGSALMQAQALQKYAGKLGFDWDNIADAVDKLDEEISELKEILPTDGNKPSPAQKAELEKELGDCMFGLVNISRKLGIDAEMASLTCVHKFRSRFAFIEKELAKVDKTPETATLTEMDTLWELAKEHE